MPGVPALSSYGIDPVTLLASDVIEPLLINAIAGPQWGIFLSAASFSGQITGLLGSLGLGAISGIVGSIVSTGALFGGPSVILDDSTVSFELKQDYSISDYPVEDGGFQSYDKVQLPTEIRVRVAAGGSLANRQAFLASIDLNMGTTLLYDVLTPEAVYFNYCFHHRDFRMQGDKGVGLIVVDLWMTQIRVTATANYINTQQPAIAGLLGGGNVQPQAAGAATKITVNANQSTY